MSPIKPNLTKQSDVEQAGRRLGNALKELLVENSFRKLFEKTGFEQAYELYREGYFPPQQNRLLTVNEGVLERSSTGKYVAALDTEDGPLLLEGLESARRAETDPQFVSPSRAEVNDTAGVIAIPTTDELINQFREAGVEASSGLICEIELTRFELNQYSELLPLLWDYILKHRDSNDREVLVAVGSAIRKYVALMPADKIGDLAVLLESGHKSPLPIELEIELAKMVYRKFEVHPPKQADPEPELADRLWELAEAYINPRVLLRDKHSAAASLAIEALVAMRSPLAQRALVMTAESPYRWFAQFVTDNLANLHDRWNEKSPEAADWLANMRNTILAGI